MQKQEEFNGLIKAIFRGGRIRKIKWGGDDDGTGWDSWSTEEKLEFAMELANAMNQAADVLQKERNEMAERVVFAEKNLENAEKALMIQKGATFNQLTSGNAELQELSKEVMSLQAELKEARATIQGLSG